MKYAPDKSYYFDKYGDQVDNDDAIVNVQDAVDFIQEWLDDDHEMPVPSTEWGTTLYMSLRMLVEDWQTTQDGGE